MATDWRRAEIDEPFRALLEFAEKLTRDPGERHDTDVARLRELGWDDEAILHTCEVISYFNFVNRMADGLGVALESDWPHPILGAWAGEPAGGEEGETESPDG